MLASSAICTATIAGASTFSHTLTNTHPGPLAAPTDISGSFDLSDFTQDLADNGLEAEVTSATVSLYGYSAANNSYSNVQSGTFTYYTYYRRRCSGWCWSSSSYTYNGSGTGYINTVTTGDTEPDQLVVDFGDTELEADTDSSTQYQYQTYSGSYSSSYSYRYYSQGNTRRTIYQRGYDYGTETDSESLLPADFGNLVNDGSLDYMLSVTAGVFDSVRVSMTINYDTRALSAVPLPAGFVFLGTSVLGFAALRRRRKFEAETA